MRLWSLHPSCLDPVGLVAVWREGLLARKVLLQKTQGYRSHPQLDRFREQSDSIRAIENYLWHIYDESLRRGYRFDPQRFGGKPEMHPLIPVTEDQLHYEMEHLAQKLADRSPEWYKKLRTIGPIRPHPLFYVVPGNIESWEKIR